MSKTPSDQLRIQIKPNSNDSAIRHDKNVKLFVKSLTIDENQISKVPFDQLWTILIKYTLILALTTIGMWNLCQRNLYENIHYQK